MNTSNLSNYFGSPQSSGESIFDQLVTPATGAAAGKGRSRSNSGSGFQDVTIRNLGNYNEIFSPSLKIDGRR